MTPTAKDTMPTLEIAQTALHQAQNDHSAAVVAASIAHSPAASLREQIASGHGPHISADDLAVATQRAEHAALVVTGATAALVGLDAAVKEANANQVADEVIRAVPTLGARVLDALDAVGAALADYQDAAHDFDGYVTGAANQLNAVGSASAAVPGAASRDARSRPDQLGAVPRRPSPGPRRWFCVGRASARRHLRRPS